MGGLTHRIRVRLPSASGRCYPRGVRTAIRRQAPLPRWKPADIRELTFVPRRRRQRLARAEPGRPRSAESSAPRLLGTGEAHFGKDRSAASFVDVSRRGARVDERPVVADTVTGPSGTGTQACVRERRHRVVLVPESAGRLHFDDVTYKGIQLDPGVQTVLHPVWRNENDNPAFAVRRDPVIRESHDGGVPRRAVRP